MSQTHTKPDRESTYRTPRWVKVLGIIALVLALLVVVVLVTGLGGPHGPGRHAPSGDAGSQTPLSSVTEDHDLSGRDLAGHASRFSVTEYGMQQL